MKAFLCIPYSEKKAKKRKTDEVGTSSAGATTSTAPPSRCFEVFLNFRGPDSRSTVVDVIRDALVRAGVQVFYDDESIRPGEVIEGELKEAITNSKIYIPVFSKDYASSKWCLLELDMILKCWEASQQQEVKKMILPIFYDVDVSTDLKLKPGSLYTIALQKHKETKGEDVVKSWEEALRTAATIKGRDLRDHGLSDLSKLTVEEVCRNLWTASDTRNVPDDYVGIDGPMKDITKLLDLDTHDVRFVIIHGMGGMGKTTLARLVFKRISSHFGQRVAFLREVRERSCTNDGIWNLQNDLLRQLFQVNSSSFLRDTDDGVNMIKNKLQNEKVLIVLDDLDKSDQLRKLFGEPSRFGVGSRIIITTRNIRIDPVDNDFYWYKMQEMRSNDALKLFSKLVFKSDLPPKEYDEISREVVDTVHRLPLAISVIAPSFRCDSKDAWERSKDAWGCRLQKLKKVVDMDVRRKLMISLENLEYHYKEIFLDIACLFLNKEIEDATYYWEAQERHPISGIMVLINMSLIEIIDGNKLGMHGLLRDLGRNLVDEKSTFPGRRSRLWSPEEALNVVRRKKGTEKVVALKLGKLDGESNFNHKQFEGFKNLKFLELNGGNFTNEDFKEVFSELRWLSWENCPPQFQATNLCFENLDVLMLSETLAFDWDGWDEIKAASNLKVLKCTYCRCLTKSSDFSAFPKLERLALKTCKTMREIDQSIGKLKHLTYLEITNKIISMERRPDGSIIYELEKGRPQILPESIGSLKSLSVLKLKFMKISKLPDAVGDLENLTYLCLWCPKVRYLPKSVGNLKLLVELDISFTAITKLPASVTNLENLKAFKCVNCALGDVPDKIKRLIPPDQLNTISIENIITELAI